MNNPFEPKQPAKHGVYITAPTNRDSIVYIDEKSCKATLTQQWLLEHTVEDGTHPITAHNVLTLFICGQESFAAIAADLKNAKSTVDIVCWGFDPSMELIRKPGTWPRGQTYGGLLKEIATREVHPVKVRLLVWYSPASNAHMHNIPGYNEAQFGVFEGEIKRPMLNTMDLPIAKKRLMHAADWWRWALDQKNKNQIEVIKRDGNKAAISALIKKEKNQPQKDGLFGEMSLLENFPSHHQKTILIDYHHEEGANAVGYVMGLNSLTGYWDTRQHLFHDPLRECQQDAPKGTSVSAVFERTKKLHGDSTGIQVDPLHDYACRIQGEALRCVHQNFYGGWLRAFGKSDKDETHVPSQLVNADKFAKGSRVQIIRTQPEDADQTIKQMYFHATAQATNYLYVENQYFQYTEWAEFLIAQRKKYRDFYKQAAPKSGPEEPNMLHVFIVIPKPEEAGMVPRTFDTLKTLGRSDLMHEKDENGIEQGQSIEMVRERDAIRDWEELHPDTMARRREFELTRREGLDNLKAITDNELAHRKYTHGPQLSAVGKRASLITEPTEKELNDVGIKILIAMLETYDDGSSGLPFINVKAKYRQIYIHSKLLIIDDAFFTLGSANLNQRSMAADSEINIASDDPAQARNLRTEVWSQHTSTCANGPSGSQLDIKLTFKRWEIQMEQNGMLKQSGKPLTSFITTFCDSKKSFVSHA